MKDIDAVLISKPDCCRAINAIATAKAENDIYFEKPLSTSFIEEIGFCNAVKDFAGSCRQAIGIDLFSILDLQVI